MESPSAHIVVVGTGYVGLTSAACLVHIGRSVTAIDINVAKVESLNRGELPIVEGGLHALVADGRRSGRLRFETDYESCATAGIVMLCLPTPLGEDGGLDLSFVRQAAFTLREILPVGAVVVTKSTVPAGTHEELAGWLDRDDLSVAANPEFLREGSAVDDFLFPDRIVIGADSALTASRVAAVYEGIDAPVQLTDPTSAELIKYAANSFLATKLGFINEISRLCDTLGGDVADVAAGIGSDHRIGHAFLQPGPGWGGSCFPKDTRGLTHVARTAGHHLPIAEAAYRSNSEQLNFIATEILRLCPTPIAHARIAVWGATFKAETDDVRESPALEIINRLTAAGATVIVYDPAAQPELIPTRTTDDPYSACRDAHVLAVLTEWPEFAEADLSKTAGLLHGEAIYDARYMIDPVQASAAGLNLYQPGRPVHEGVPSGPRAHGQNSPDPSVVGPRSDGGCDPNTITLGGKKRPQLSPFRLNPWS